MSSARARAACRTAVAFLPFLCFLWRLGLGLALIFSVWTITVLLPARSVRVIVIV